MDQEKNIEYDFLSDLVKDAQGKKVEIEMLEETYQEAMRRRLLQYRQEVDGLKAENERLRQEVQQLRRKLAKGSTEVAHGRGKFTMPLHSRILSLLRQAFVRPD